MTGFPPSPYYTGLNAPIGEEYDLTDLAVEGAIPAEVEGTFFRATPDPAYPPFLPDNAAALSGDGMISALPTNPKWQAWTVPSPIPRRSGTQDGC
jgi:carotenoid cleavage dioxygenase-like enzyme